MEDGSKSSEYEAIPKKKRTLNKEDGAEKSGNQKKAKN